MHWYDLDGKPNHDKGMKEARVMPLVPSVTGINQDMARNYGIDQYVYRKTIDATRKLRPDAKYDEIIKESQRHMNEAAEWGDVFHNAAEYINLNGKIPKTNHMTPEQVLATNAYMEYMTANVDKILWAEKTFCHVYEEEQPLFGRQLYGYGGCVDLLYIDKQGKLVLGDFKTKDGLPKSVYNEHKYQLAAYSRAVWEEYRTPDRYEIIFIDRNTGDLKQKDVKMYPEYERIFKNVCNNWWLKARMTKDYASLRKVD